MFVIRRHRQKAPRFDATTKRRRLDEPFARLACSAPTPAGDPP